MIGKYSLLIEGDANGYSACVPEIPNYPRDWRVARRADHTCQRGDSYLLGEHIDRPLPDVDASPDRSRTPRLRMWPEFQRRKFSALGVFRPYAQQRRLGRSYNTGRPGRSKLGSSGDTL